MVKRQIEIEMKNIFYCCRHPSTSSSNSSSNINEFQEMKTSSSFGKPVKGATGGQSRKKTPGSMQSLINNFRIPIEEKQHTLAPTILLTNMKRFFTRPDRFFLLFFFFLFN